VRETARCGEVSGYSTKMGQGVRRATSMERGLTGEGFNMEVAKGLDVVEFLGTGGAPMIGSGPQRVP
jgi:hypothetical protein